MEQQPQPEQLRLTDAELIMRGIEAAELDTYELGERSLRGWHQFLTTDSETGEDTGHLDCPGSRYGETSKDCAWWAVAGEIVYVNANGESDDTEASLDWLMGLAANDNEELGELVREYWHVIPEELKDKLNMEDSDAERDQV